MHDTPSADPVPRLVREMLEPGFYPDPPASVELRETHASWVFIAGELAYKVKKPLKLPFLDYGTLERRRSMCRAEVELNRRLAPDYYRCVRSIVERDARLRLGAEEDPEACEYAIEMVAIPEHLTLERVGSGGGLKRSQLRAVAARIAAFHRQAAIPAEPERSVERLAGALAENNDTLAKVGPPAIEAERVRAAERFTAAALSALRPRLTERARGGLVRDGHGDLRAEHVLLTDPVQIYDCIEFDPGLREIDVATDLSFLVMDLARLGLEAEALALPELYSGAGGDPGDPSLLAFLAAYRAWVRAKVARLSPGSDSEAGAERARRLHRLGHRFAWRARRPFALFVAGIAASGKSTLAAALHDLSGVTVLTADAVRKELGGVPSRSRAPAELYSPQFSRRTYAELGRRAAAQLDASGAVIVDATARRRSDRAAFRAAVGAGAPVAYAICEAPAEVLLARARARESDPERLSDAGPTVVEEQLGTFEPIEGAEAEAVTAVRTDGNRAETLAAVESLLDRVAFSEPDPGAAWTARAERGGAG